MSFRNCLCLVVSLASGSAIAQESGYQVIRGTRVFTRIDHASDTATFSNDCGSQTLSHAALAAGAIPTDIIPCPRGSSENGRAPSPATKSQDWLALVNKGGSATTRGVSSLDAGDYPSASDAFNEALSAFVEAQDLVHDDQRYHDLWASSVEKGAMASCYHGITSILATKSNNSPIDLFCANVQKSGKLAIYYQRAAAIVAQDRASRSAGAQPAAKPVQLAPDSCIEATRSRRISSACDFKDDVPQFETSLRVSPTPGCPTELTAGYTTPYESGEQKISLTQKYQKLWTCVAGPSGLHVIP